MHENENGPAAWNNVESAVRDGCLKTCELGPSISGLSHGPDGGAQVHVTTCRAHCEAALCHRLATSPADHPLKVALAKAGEPFVTTAHFDEGAEPFPKAATPTT